MGKVIQFPTPKYYEEFVRISGLFLAELISSLNLIQDKGFLDNKMFKMILDRTGIDLNQDLTETDKAILRFHCKNYYNLEVSF